MLKDNWKPLVFLGILLAAGAAFIYGRVFAEDTTGDYQVRKGNYRLEDGLLEDALEEFEAAIEVNPNHPGAHLGLALTLLQMGRVEEAIARLDRTVTIDPAMAVAYANRGIARDRLGQYEEALADYRTAIELDEKMVRGPGWLWRFLHNASEQPSTVRARADYLAEELAKPEGERVLQLAEKDNEQRMYKIK